MQQPTPPPTLVAQQHTQDGLTTHYVRGGQGPRVLLLHGWGGSSHSWQPVLEALLSLGYEVLAVDFPGFGQSDLPPQPWGVPDYSAALHRFLLALDYHPADIIAHSFGGRVALVLAATQPAAVNRLVLAASAGIRTGGPSPLVRFASKAGKAALNLPGLAGLRERARTRLYHALGAQDYLDAGPLRETFVKVVEQDLRDYAAQVHAPTLLIWGDRDTDTPLAQAHVLEAHISDSALIVLPGAGHFCYLDELPRFMRIVAEFFKDASSASNAAVPGSPPREMP